MASRTTQGARTAFPPPLRCILIVEDDRQFAGMLLDILYEELEPRPEIVAHAHSLAEALPIVQQEQFDLAIVDLTLPDAHDMTAVSLLRQHAPLLPILVMTGSTDPVLRQRAERLPAVGWLQKTGELSRDDVITQCRLTVQAGRYLQVAQRVTEEPRVASDFLLTAAREQSSMWKNAVVVVIGVLWAVTTGVATWAHLDLKKTQAEDKTKIEKKQEAADERLQTIAAEQARRKSLIDQVEGLRQQVAMQDSRLQQLQERIDAHRYRLERLEQMSYSKMPGP